MTNKVKVWVPLGDCHGCKDADRIMREMQESSYKASTIAIRKIISQADHMDKLVDERDKWEDLASRLAGSVGELLGVDVGEHSSAHCPVLSAISHIEREIANDIGK